VIKVLPAYDFDNAVEAFLGAVSFYRIDGIVETQVAASLIKGEYP